MTTMTTDVDERRAVAAEARSARSYPRDQRALFDAVLDPRRPCPDRSLKRGAAPSPGRVEETCCGDADVSAGLRGHVQVRLLGGFEVVVDGTPRPTGRWTKRSAAALVKLLALSPRGRLHRERVVDALWPDTSLEVALPRLHKASHYARRDLGDREAVVLRDQVVMLFPDATLEVDVIDFEAAADLALASRPASIAATEDALELAGELLPDDLAEWWLEGPRDRLRLRVAQLLREARRWEELLRLDPAHEEAHLELLREAVRSGDRTSALRRFSLMERTLRSELGISPGREALALREHVAATAVR